ncbi:RNA polymerase subunit sigma-70 [Enemella sp. A6]|uniref:RNA polymerase subunit sigma-70 n=1 Tax=Enemella sp. A6 TaxID=3440152 RepID=UPI003EBCA9FC
MDSKEFETEALPLRAGLLAHCYRMMGSAVDAEDQVQETYLRAWRACHRFEGRASVKNWMYRIATNTCLNALSSAQRRLLPTDLGGAAGDPAAPIHPRPEQPWLEPLPDAMLWQNASPTPEEELLARENITLAWAAAMQHLTPQQRAVLLLREVLGFSAAETAEALNTTVASVNSMLQRCRATVGEGLPATNTDTHTEDERAAVDAFVDAFERHDFDAIVSSMSQDVVWQMPPFDRWYAGNRDAAVLAFTHCPAREAGDLRFRPARANGQPALGMYLRKGEEWEAFQFLILSVREGTVGRVTAWFDPHLFRLAGLPLILDDQPS